MWTRLLPMRRCARRATHPVRRPHLETLETRALLAAVTWTGGAGDNNWDTAANWSTDSVPGPHDDVTINIPANVVHSDNVTDSINSLTSTEPLTISGGTLSIAAASTIDNTLSLTSGTLTDLGDLSVSGLVSLTSGTLSGSGALNADGGMLINPGYLNFEGCTINNPAGQTATWNGGGSGLGYNIQVSDGSVFNNLGTFTITEVAGYLEATAGDNSSFNNMGTVSVTASGGQGEVYFDVPFNMIGGSFDVTDGTTATLSEGTSTGGAFSIGSGAYLQLGGEFSTLSGGNFQNGDYSVDPTTTFSGTGNLSVPGSSTLILPAKYNFAGSTTDGGVLQVDGSIIGSGMNVVVGTLSGTGTVGAMSVEGGEVSPGDGSNPGILYVEGPADFAAFITDGPGQPFSTLNVQLNGPTPGTGYSQLDVAGAVDLEECTLNASLGFTPANAEQFTIIKSTSPIVGTFNGLPEGSLLTIGNTNFTISYHGGDGNDVVLTQTGTISTPTVSGVTPNTGPAAGGTLVTITGTGFTGATAVDFGTNPASGITVVNGTTITALSPAGSGAVDVTVVIPAGTSATTAADRFTYTTAQSAPTVTGVSPSSGPAAGGTLVTVTGTGFTGATAVDFGTKPATGVTVVNDTTITADSPAGSGSVDVTVVTPAGTSATTSADQFTYRAAVAAPAVTGISPSSGPAAGGTLVTITGTGFTGATAVDFGTSPARGVSVVNSTTITADSPAGSGLVDVTVVTPAGTSAATAADRFTYTQVAAAPAVVSVERFGFHMHPTTLVLTFNVPLDPARAQDVNNYQIVAMAGGERDAVVAGHVTRVRAAVYNAAALTVTLYPRQRLNIHNFYRLTVYGAPPNGLRSASGIPLDSQGNGDPGNKYETILSWKNLVVTPAQARKYFHGKVWQV